MKITMAHGSGGQETAALIEKVFASRFQNPVLAKMEDAAVVPGARRLALTTDSFVVTPLFFPGGDIGRLSVCGTVNDLLMSGAIPKYLTCGFILEEGAKAASILTPRAPALFPQTGNWVPAIARKGMCSYCRGR